MTDKRGIVMVHVISLVYGGLNVLEVQMGVCVATELSAQHPKTTKAG